MKGGVHTEYLKSVFPSESFPTWQTINTGKLTNYVIILEKLEKLEKDFSKTIVIRYWCMSRFTTIQQS